MKKKYQGLTSICLILSVLGVIVLYSIIASFEINDDLRINRQSPLSAMNVPSPSDFEEIQQISYKMAGLISPPGPSRLPVNLMVFGYQNDIQGNLGMQQNHRRSELNEQVNYSISFAFSSGKKRFCIIDGEFYKEQSDIQHGGKVLKIESKRVLVSKHGINKWISVDGSEIEAKGGKKRVLFKNK